MLFPLLLQFLSVFISPDKDFITITDRLHNTAWSICANDSCVIEDGLCIFSIDGFDNKQSLSLRYHSPKIVIDPITGKDTWFINSCTPVIEVNYHNPENGEYNIVFYSESVGKAVGVLKFVSDSEFVLTYSNSKSYRQHYKRSQIPPDLKEIMQIK